MQAFLEKWALRYSALKNVQQREDSADIFAYLDYDRRIRRMIYTTNWIERFNKNVRRTTKIRNSFPSPHSALMLIGYVGMEIEQGCYKYPIANFKFDEKLLN